MFDTVEKLLDNRKASYFRFIDKRIVAADQHTLSRKNLFIFPTARGFIYLFIAIFLWVLGTNYQNNLILALAFFMVSLFVLAILLTFQNLNKLVIKFNGLAGDAFADQEAQFKVVLSKSSRQGAEEIQLAWFGSEREFTAIHYAQHSEEEHYLTYFCQQRGLHKLPRLRIQSYFPLGIIRCWTWLSWEQPIVIYPKPLNGSLGSLTKGTDDDADGLHPVKGGEDFSGLKQYVSGDPLRRVAWKTFAKGQGLFVKDFNESLSSEKWLDYDVVVGMSKEDKLSILSFWVLHLYQEDECFGLHLPNTTIKPSSGRAHRNDCLKKLAEF